MTSVPDTKQDEPERPAVDGQAPPPVMESFPTAAAPQPSPAAHALRGLVRFYRLFFSAWLGAGCRYVPSCSQYAIGALERHGALGGSYLAAWRVLRCHPGCAGGRDEVPEQLPRLFGFLAVRPADGDAHPADARGRSISKAAAPTLRRPSPETTP